MWPAAARPAPGVPLQGVAMPSRSPSHDPLDLPDRSGLLGALSDREFATLKSALLARSYEPERPLYYEGTPSLAAYLLQRGTVKLWRMGHAGDQHVIGLRGPGDLLGYRAVMAGSPYGVTAEPLEPTIASTIPRETFLALVRENGQFAFRLLESMARQSLDTEDRLMSRIQDSVLRRTATILLHLGSQSGRASRPPPNPCLPRKREDLARLIGTTPETLSRTLHALASQGILDLSNKGIRVVDLDSLRRLAG